MKKIISKEETEKKEKRNQLIVGVLLVGVMLFSTIGYSIMSKDENSSDYETTKYNGFEFLEKNELWYLEFSENVFVFTYNPNEIERIDSYASTLENYYNQPLYIFSENSQAKLEIYRNMNNYVQRIQDACLDGEKCLDKNFPVKNCENDNFIIIKESKTSGIKQENKCVFIEGNNETIVKNTDEFLFKILSIV